MSEPTSPAKITQADLAALLVERFGSDPMAWAFVCPVCGDVATGQDFRDALATNPATRRYGTVVTASDRIGQECIGRTLGALTREPYTGRGCDWTAYGLFRGPVLVTLADGSTMGAFHVAAAPA